ADPLVNLGNLPRSPVADPDRPVNGDPIAVDDHFMDLAAQILELDVHQPERLGERGAVAAVRHERRLGPGPERIVDEVRRQTAEHRGRVALRPQGEETAGGALHGHPLADPCGRSVLRLPGGRRIRTDRAALAASTYIAASAKSSSRKRK